MRLHQLPEVLADRGRVERLARQVDRQRDVTTGGVVIVEHRDGLGHDPVVDRLDQIEALGVVEKRSGRDEVAMIVLHSKQQLKSRDAV